MMIEILEFIFRDFWTFAGVAILLYLILHYGCNMVCRWSPWNHARKHQAEISDIEPVSGGRKESDGD